MIVVRPCGGRRRSLPRCRCSRGRRPSGPAVWRATTLEVDVGGERLAARVDAQDLLAALRGRAAGRAPAGRSGRAAAAPGRGPGAGSTRPSRRPGRASPKPSSSTSSWLSVWSCSRLNAVARARGADRVELVDEDDRRRVLARLRRTACGCARRRGRRTSRRRPTRSASRSCAPDSWATAFASSVLPVPGGP